ncbi:hypothetical protein L211DRAFT_841195 [Terfezia boudieri ATCC MYA-4762]|uniref:Uncharacterized protein n=1 Tax=Terfezia boudieri ATCC MYA-4762 TaxID=1051890 RepID=A0A3N4LDD2_9PEZI|nr:hypothetical protein L211DRAFT_841195 [Terfezia boudieri ATCC MYA-4762]
MTSPKTHPHPLNALYRPGDLYLASVAAGVEGGMCKMVKLEVPIHRHPQYHRSASTLRGYW